MAFAVYRGENAQRVKYFVPGDPRPYAGGGRRATVRAPNLVEVSGRAQKVDAPRGFASAPRAECNSARMADHLHNAEGRRAARTSPGGDSLAAGRVVGAASSPPDLSRGADAHLKEARSPRAPPVIRDFMIRFTRIVEVEGSVLTVYPADRLMLGRADGRTGSDRCSVHALSKCRRYLSLN